MTPEGRRETRLDTILLNGNNVAIVRRPARRSGRGALHAFTSPAQLVPGGLPDAPAAAAAT